jgi:hypothetical protein
MSYVIPLICVALLAFVAWRERDRSIERAAERKSFNEERGIWIRERRDLNNRIQVPQAAPFMDTGDGPSDNDLPLLPDFTIDEAELERAKAELNEMGYAEGPAL